MGSVNALSFFFSETVQFMFIICSESAGTILVQTGKTPAERSS